MWGEIKDLGERVKAAPLKVKIGLGAALVLALTIGLHFTVQSVKKTKKMLRDNVVGMGGLAKAGSAPTALTEMGNLPQIISKVEEKNFASVRTQAAYSPSEYQERKVIRQAWMNVEIKNSEEAMKKAMDMARSYNADVFALDTQNPEKGGAWVNITFLVDPSKLDGLMETIGTLGTVKGRTAQARDVTEQYVDLKGQLTNAERVRDRLIQLLNNRTENLKYVLEVERELARVGGTIESLKGKIRYLDSQTDRSRLEVRLFEKAAGERDPHPFWDQIKNALNRFGNVFIETTAGIFVFLGFILGLGVYAILIFGIVLLFKRSIPKKGNNSEKK